MEQDDLKEVPTCEVDGKRLFYARGPVSWETETAERRTRNYYSNYGYYFLTEDTSSEPAKVDYDTFVACSTPHPTSITTCMSRMATHGTRVDATSSVRSRYRKAHTRLSTSPRIPTPRRAISTLW